MLPTILSISMDRELLFLRGKILEGAGFRVLSVISVDEAAQALAEEPVDALLIGHSLSTEEAIKLAKMAKSIRKGIKVCRLQKSWMTTTDGGAIDHFIDAQGPPEELIECVREALGKDGRASMPPF